LYTGEIKHFVSTFKVSISFNYFNILNKFCSIPNYKKITQAFFSYKSFLHKNVFGEFIQVVERNVFRIMSRRGVVSHQGILVKATVNKNIFLL
jgi:hypothetical protein